MAGDTLNDQGVVLAVYGSLSITSDHGAVPVRSTLRVASSPSHMVALPEIVAVGASLIITLNESDCGPIPVLFIPQTLT